MENKKSNIIRLGLFVLSGLAILILSLFLIGRNQHMIGSHYILKARFQNVSGLRDGNNVRYAGIEVGTVDELRIIDDTTLEVLMLINSDMKKVIRKNALASIGADGLMGNKVVNIVPQPGQESYASDGDLLASRMAVDFDDIIRNLSGITGQVREIAQGLRTTVDRINTSQGIWKLLGDTSLDTRIRSTLANLDRASGNAQRMTVDLQEMVSDVKAGEGNLGMILRDSGMALQLQASIGQLEEVTRTANQLAIDLQKISGTVKADMDSGDGTLNLVLKDTALSGSISRTMLNVEKGTAAFQENMEAMKHNFLFRGYFKKQEKQKAKQQLP
jgi:phospholipid/cholesterol/gamma-HCH transport system substrate-binding protein